MLKNLDKTQHRNRLYQELIAGKLEGIHSLEFYRRLMETEHRIAGDTILIQPCVVPGEKRPLGSFQIKNSGVWVNVAGPAGVKMVEIWAGTKDSRIHGNQNTISTGIPIEKMIASTWTNENDQKKTSSRSRIGFLVGQRGRNPTYDELRASTIIFIAAVDQLVNDIVG